MRVNVFKTVISKTFMKSGLKVLHPLNKTKPKTKSKTKSNNNYLGFFLNLYEIIRQTLYLESLTNLGRPLPLLSLAKLCEIFTELFSFYVFSRLTVLMNDFRLKTFCDNTKSKKSFKSSNKTIVIISSTLNHRSLSIKNSAISTSSVTLPSTTSSPSTALPVALASAILFKSTSSNNNHHRTYNNNSKSNKVFLYYTPRDPRLRIFLKTKQTFSRPLQQQKAQLIKLIKRVDENNKSLLNIHILNDLCNYGEFVGGCRSISSARKNSEQINGVFIITNNKYNSNNIHRELKQSIDICDNLIGKSSDNIYVVAAAALKQFLPTFLLSLLALVNTCTRRGNC